jgi:hypothetical protein
MKNLHLVPINIQDLVEKLNDKNIRENELMNYQLRLEAIRDYCAEAIYKHNISKPIDHSKNKRMYPNTRKR